MKCTIIACLLCAVVLIVLISASTSGTVTLRPFVRSRYSRRWRVATTTEISNKTLTTENVKMDAVSTEVAPATSNALLVATTVTAINSSASAATSEPPEVHASTMASIVSTTQSVQMLSSTSTEPPKHTGPNGMPLDYDYYGNGGENEDEAVHT